MLKKLNTVAEYSLRMHMWIREDNPNYFQANR